MMRSLCLLLLALVVIGSAGCSRDRALRGKWVLDREYTEQQLKAPSAPESSAPGGPAVAVKDASLMSGLKEMAGAMLAPMLLAQLDGMTVTITPKEILTVDKAGSGKALTYEVIERPTGQTWRVKTADGEISTFERQGERLVMTATGAAQFRIYMKLAVK